MIGSIINDAFMNNLTINSKMAMPLCERAMTLCEGEMGKTQFLLKNLIN